MNSNRRDFLRKGTLMGTALMTSTAFGFANNVSTPTENSNLEVDTKHRVLGFGDHAITVSSLGLGCMGMSYHRSFVPERKAMIHLIRKARDLGVNLFDTAEAYGPFLNEDLVGEALQPFRKEIILSTKFGFTEGKPELGLDSRPETIRKAVDRSLKRLRTDYVDLLYQHRIDPKVPIEDVAGTVKELISAGKVRHFGMSERDFNATKGGLDAIRKAHQVQPITAIQSEYSVMTRNPETNVLTLCEEMGIGFVPYSPLTRGYLTGYINERSSFNPKNDNRVGMPRYQPKNIIANWPLIDILKSFGDQRGLTVAQVALAWLSAQKPFIVSIPGTTKLAHLQENMASAGYVFTTSELNKLTTDLSAVEIEGERYTTGYPERRK